MKHVSLVGNNIDNADFKYVWDINLSFTVDEIIAKTYQLTVNQRKNWKS